MYKRQGYGFSQPAYFAYDDVAVRFEKTPTPGLLGDVDGSGEIDTLDAALLYAHVNGRIVLSKDQLSRSDVDGDGEITTVDAALIYAFVNGRIKKFPIE